MRGSWPGTAEPLSMTVRCAGVDHRLRWCDGEVVPVDHPELEAELAIIGLGGPEPVCLQRLRLWTDAVTDGGFLGEWIDDTRLTPSWFSWLAMALERMRSEGFHEFLRRLPPRRAQRMGEFLHHFPPAWIDRAAATVADSITGGPGVACGLAPDLVPLAIAHRVRRAFVQSVGGGHVPIGAAALIPLHVHVVAGATPAATGSLTGPERAVAITVDDRWLHQVWATGAAVVDEHLVLAAQPDGPDRAALTVVTWPDRVTPVVGTRPAIHADHHWTLEP